MKLNYFLPGHLQKSLSRIAETDARNCWTKTGDKLNRTSRTAGSEHIVLSLPWILIKSLSCTRRNSLPQSQFSVSLSVKSRMIELMKLNSKHAVIKVFVLNLRKEDKSWVLSSISSGMISRLYFVLSLGSLYCIVSRVMISWVKPRHGYS